MAAQVAETATRPVVPGTPPSNVPSTGSAKPAKPARPPIPPKAATESGVFPTLSAAKPSTSEEPWADADEAGWLLKLAKARVAAVEEEEREWRAKLAQLRASELEVTPRAEGAKTPRPKQPPRPAARPALRPAAPIQTLAPAAPEVTPVLTAPAPEEEDWSALLARAATLTVDQPAQKRAEKPKKPARPTAQKSPPPVPEKALQAAHKVPPPVPAKARAVPPPPARAKLRAVPALASDDVFAPLIPFVPPKQELVSWPPMAQAVGA